VEFAAKDQEWLAINDELGGYAALLEVRSIGLLSRECDCRERGKEQQNWERRMMFSHVEREDSMLCPAAL
jgi:hypothetical protein